MSHKSLVVPGIGLSLFAGGFFVWGYHEIAPYLFSLQFYLMSITVWDVLSALAPILAPIISLVLALFGKILWTLHKRVSDNEESITKLWRSVYGDDDDHVQEGLTKDQSDLRDVVDDISSDVQQLKEEMDIDDE